MGLTGLEPVTCFKIYHGKQANIGTIHRPAFFREFQLMKEAGLTPMQILQCATANAAKLSAAKPARVSGISKMAT